MAHRLNDPSMLSPYSTPQRGSARDRLRDKSNANADWSDAGPRLAPQVWPAFTPGFVVPPGGTVFTVGSCFARNIEEHVARLGFRVPTLAFSVPDAERAGGRGNAVLNKYTPAAIRQEFDWARRILEAGGTVTPDHVAPLAFTCTDGQEIDLHLGGYRPVSPERLLARRQQLFDAFRHAFTADCVVLTLGLVEAWIDEATGLAIQQAPVQAAFRRHLDRFSFRRLDFAGCRAEVQAAIDTVRAVNPAATFLITTSPVPLDRTFTDDDVITATMHGKSVLRAVCGEIVAANERVDYFPSYESVILTRDWSVFQSDRRHVSDAFVGKIVQRLVDTYFREAPAERRAAHAAYMASLAGETTDADALRSLSEAAPQDVRAFVHYLNALTTRPEALAAAVARYLEGRPAPEHVARVARTTKRDIDDAATVLGAIARGLADAAGEAAVAPAAADVWRLWVQALLREERIAEAVVAIADAGRRWPDDEGFSEFATMAKRRARRAGLQDATAADLAPAVAPAVAAAPTPIDTLTSAFEGGDPGAIATALGAALDAGATAEAVVEIGHQAKRAAREGIVSPRLAALAAAITARAAASGSAPDPAFFPLWRLLSQALWREDRRAEALAAAQAAVALWPDGEDAGDHLNSVERKVRKQGLEPAPGEPDEAPRDRDAA